MKKTTVMAFALVVAVALIFLARGLADSSENIENESGKAGADIGGKTLEEKSIRVWIKLKERNAEKLNLLKKDTKEIIIANIGKENIRHDFGSSFSAVVNEKDLSMLENNPNIEKINRVGRRKLLLQGSASQINATLTYSVQVNGVNITGLGESICIIDGGVNYTHPALGGCYGNNSLSSQCKVWGGYDFVNEDPIPEDEDGHGTHVAGIAAANGTINGIAKDARIIAIKACDSEGGCNDDDIAAGINWCIGNATAYNISVISMSLGSDEVYENYCNDDPLAEFINNAVGNNISVVIASGNSGSATGISAPACVENATPVGSVNDHDIILFNRNFMVQLLAPGDRINSTNITGGYSALSGTSISTPHVSGAIALISQYLGIKNRTKTPAEVEDVLNRTGKGILDHVGISSGLTFSRMNIYDAIQLLDGPRVTLTSPFNGSYTNKNAAFLCNGSSAEPLQTATLYIWNSSGLELARMEDISGFSTSILSHYDFPHQGEYSWNCLFSNRINAEAFAPGNFSITYDSIAPEIDILPPWNSGIFNVSINENGTCIYSLDYGVLNYSMSANSSGTGFNATDNTLVPGHSYNVTYYCNDSIGNWNSSRIDFIIDKPNLPTPAPTLENNGERRHHRSGNIFIILEDNKGLKNNQSAFHETNEGSEPIVLNEKPLKINEKSAIHLEAKDSSSIILLTAAESILTFVIVLMLFLGRRMPSSRV
jgi:hypothetical protein